MRWIWMAILGSVFFGAAWWAMNMGWDVAAAMLGLVMLVFAVASLAEFTSHYGEINSIIFERRQTAMNTTPIVMIAESLRGLHPENTRLLSKFVAQTVWDVTVDLQRGERDWMLRGYDVHFGFVEFVLDGSRNGRLCPRNRFAEGSRKWDPNGVVEDREQHRQFEEWLATRLIVVRQFGDNNPAMFMPPWTPEKLKVTMGFEGPQDLYKPEEAVVRNLSAAKPAPAAVVAAQPKVRDETQLTEDEMRVLQSVQEAHEQKYKMSPSEYLQLKNGQSN